MCREGSNFFFAAALQSHGLGDIIKFVTAQLVQLLAFGGDLLVDLEGLLGHGLVGFLCAAEEGKIRTCRDAFVPVGVHSEAEHERFFLHLWLLRHVSHYGVLTILPSGKGWTNRAVPGSVS